MGITHIRIGDDREAYSTNNEKIVDNITDGGFFEATEILSGKYINVRRDQNSFGAINLYSFKAYQTPNLIKAFEASIQVTSDTSAPSNAGFGAVNLI